MKTKEKKEGEIVKTKKKTGLVEKKKDAGLDVIASHPVLLEMAGRIQAVHGILKKLPQLVGEAVADAIRRLPPQGASRPPVPVIVPKEVVIQPQKLTVDGKETLLPKPAAQETESTSSI